MVRQIVNWPDSVGRDEHGNIIKKSEQTFTIFRAFEVGLFIRHFGLSDWLMSLKANPAPS